MPAARGSSWCGSSSGRSAGWPLHACWGGTCSAASSSRRPGDLWRGFTRGWRAQWEIYGLGGGSIVFDYGARTHRFGSKLDEAESRQLTELLAKELRLTPPVLEPERPGSY
jgi:hypothetical protein